MRLLISPVRFNWQNKLLYDADLIYAHPIYFNVYQTQLLLKPPVDRYPFSRLTFFILVFPDVDFSS